jgi:hypothetical protein
MKRREGRESRKYSRKKVERPEEAEKKGRDT